jgi:hypothetical protein
LLQWKVCVILGAIDGIPSTDPQGFKRASPGALKSAIAKLRAGLRADGTYEDISEWDTHSHQWSLLAEWSRVVDWPIRYGGREHDVYHDQASSRWFKLTKPSAAGFTIEICEGQLFVLAATPLQYLARWRIGNHIFGDDVAFLGLAIINGKRRLAISQRDITGETPTWEEIEDLFTIQYGMRRLQLPPETLVGDYDARGYFRGRYGVFDVRPLNCVRTVDNKIVPIDVIPRVYGCDEARVLKRLSF